MKNFASSMVQWSLVLRRRNQLAAAPEGLELTDLYALTIQENAGLEIHHVELMPPKVSNERSP